jgi:hypothetical protein
MVPPSMREEVFFHYLLEDVPVAPTGFPIDAPVIFFLKFPLKATRLVQQP